MDRFRRKPRPLVGTLAGVAGGLFASWAMNQFQSFWSKVQEKAKARQPQQQSASEQGEPATVKAAEKVAHALGRDLGQQGKEKAGPLVHYLFGGSMGAAYGLISEYLPQARLGFGVLFGTALFALADEIAVPALGLSKWPIEYPLSTHAYALASHVVYGLSTEAVRKTVRAAA